MTLFHLFNFRWYELTYEKSVALRITFTSQKKKLHQRVLELDRNENLNLISDFTVNKRIETFQFLLKVTLLF